MDKFLSTIELFRDLDEHEQQLVADTAAPKTFREGQFLFEENAPRTGLFLLQEGEVELLSAPPSGMKNGWRIFARATFWVKAY